MSAGFDSAATTFVLLRLGAQRFALPADSVEELAASSSLQTFPHTTPSVEGVIVRRGRVIPVRDVARVLFGRPSSLHRFYLIARQFYGAVREPTAIPVGGECELVSGLIPFPPDDGNPAWIAGLLDIDGERIPVLDLEKLDGMQSASAGAQYPGGATP